MSPEQSGRAGRAWPIVLIVVILALTTCCVAIMSRRSAEAGVETSADADWPMVLVQHLAFFVMVGLFAWHQRRVLVFLIKLAGCNWVIGAEIMLLLAIVYGAFGSFGVPELFWNDSTITVGVAGFSAMLFLELAWFAIYLVDYSRPTRSQHRRLEWNQVEPFVVDSGLPRLLRMPTQDVSPRWQLGWFLAIACLPGLFLLALPAFLPAVRPSSDPRVVEWTWLAGLVLGVAVPPILLFTRPISFFVRQLRKGFGKPMAPDRPSALFQHPGVLLWLLGSVYVAALIADRFQPRWIVPAALFCLLLAMIAVAVAFFLSFRSRTAQVWTALLVLTTILLNSIQTYDPCYRGLECLLPTRSAAPAHPASLPVLGKRQQYAGQACRLPGEECQKSRPGDRGAEPDGDSGCLEEQCWAPDRPGRSGLRQADPGRDRNLWGRPSGRGLDRGCS